jgi:hypothetical protein
MTAEVSDCPRPQDISQLRSAYLMHRQECKTCDPDQLCEMAQRLEEARRKFPDGAGLQDALHPSLPE